MRRVDFPDIIEDEEEDPQLSQFVPVGAEYGAVVEELQVRKKLPLSAARTIASQMIYGIMMADIESRNYITSIFDHASTEESAYKVMARVRRIKRENLH